MPHLLPDSEFQIAWSEYGRPDGTPVFYFHGMPGSSLEAMSVDSIARDLNLRLIAPERPGYGDSASRIDFSLQDWPLLISELAEQLKLDHFSILGYSGGGPYALACAHYMPSRINRIVLVSSPAPLSSKVMRQNINADFKPLFELAATDHAAALQQLSPMVASAEVLMGIMQAPLSGSDKTLFEQDEFRKNYLQNLSRAIQQGSSGFINDLRCLYLPWPFDLEDIQLPIDIWHGRNDINIGFPVAEFLTDAMRNASPHFLHNSGHFFIFSHWKEILESLK